MMKAKFDKETKQMQETLSKTQEIVQMKEDQIQTQKLELQKCTNLVKTSFKIIFSLVQKMKEEQNLSYKSELETLEDQYAHVV